ncbi:MAG: hypothetical protein C0514_01400 [Candidatus Puniceispirillum sp.]|nr:hypothetical protein [Candidatus Puniceispirillum sp.]
MRRLLLFTLFITHVCAFASPEIQVFSFENPEAAENIRVRLSGMTSRGTPWQSRNISGDDLPLLMGLYGDEKVMAHFAGGLTLEQAQVERRLDTWTRRAREGVPIGAWVIESEIDDKLRPLGFVAVAAQHAPGYAEMGGMLFPEFQSLGIASSLMHVTVNIWAPRVRWHGRFDPNPRVREKFCCFGGKALQALYATASPENERSWRSQRSAGFVPIEPNAGSITLKTEVKTYKETAQALTELFTADVGSLPFDTLFSFKDHKGIAHTLSYVSEYKCVKFHMMRTVEDWLPSRISARL